MARFHISLNLPDVHRMLCYLIFFFLIQKFKHTLCSSGRRLEKVRNLSNLLDRLGKVSDILEKRLYITHCNFSFNHHNTAKKGDHNIAQISHKLHNRHHHAREKLRTPCRSIKFFIGCFKFFYYVFLFVKGFYHILPTVDFLNLTVHFPQIFLLRLEIFLGAFHNPGNNQHGNRQNQNSRQSHPYINGKHHNKNTNQHGHRSNQLCETLVNTGLQGIHIIGNPGQNLSVGSAFKIFHGQAVNLFGNIFSQTISHLIRNTCHNPALNKGKSRTYQIKSQSPQQNFTDFSEINSAASADF